MSNASRTATKIALVVLGLLVVGFLLALAEGFVPKTVGHVLLALLVVGPILLFGEAILEFFLQVIAYGVGRALLPIVTFGQMRAETSNENFSFPWHGVAREANGKRVASIDATSLFGLLAIALGAAVGFFLYFWP